MAPSDPSWRDAAAAALAAESLPYLDLEETALVMGDHRPDVPHALDSLGMSHQPWVRRAFGGVPATDWPPREMFDAVLVRLAKAREEQEMTFHAGLARLRPGGRLVVYGANDEGARSAAKLLEPLVGEVYTVTTGRRCRVLSAVRPGEIPGLKGRREEWRAECEAPASGLPEPWITYPGVFAGGRLDDGTALLVEHLPELPVGARVLDFGCGSGVVGAVAQARGDAAQVELLDVDALALAAARENVPGAVIHLGHDLTPVQDRSYEAVLANPPYHRGKAETLQVVRELVEGAPAVLRPGGTLTLVTQRRLPTEKLLRSSFGSVRALADRGPYRVWEGRTS